MAEAEREPLVPPLAGSSRDGPGGEAAPGMERGGEAAPGMERRAEPGQPAAAEEEDEARPDSPPFFLLYPGHGAAAPPGVWRPPAPRGGAALPVLLLSYTGPDGAAGDGPRE